MGLAKAIADMKRFSQGSFSVEITFTNITESESVVVNGLISKHNLSINPENGLPVNAKNAHISVVESVLNDADYTTRNAENEIDLKDHKVSFTDLASEINFTYLIDESMPSETTGLIVCTLGDHING